MNRFSLLFLAAAVAIGLASPAVRATDAGFSFEDKKGEHLDVLLDGKIVGRYMYAHDASSKDRRLETYKPYLHVFDAEGKAPITKGAGGEYTHHRGIYIGWNKVTHGGKTLDLWHMPKSEIVHQKFADQKADKDAAAFTSITDWNNEEGKPILEEERTTTFRRAPAPARVAIDFRSRLKAPNGPVKLDGDPEHAGIHFRPANEVSRAETVYVYPKEDAKPHDDRDYPWVGETFSLKGKRHSVVEMSHPGNPKGTRWSAYRNYGRFGAFPTAEVTAEMPLELNYRFLIADGEMVPVEAIQKSWDEFAGMKEPSPTPKTTVKPAEGSGKPAVPKPTAPKPAAAAK